MNILHVKVEVDDGWLIAQGLEERGVITQARTFDELIANIREVVELLRIGSKDLHIELIVPPAARRIAGARLRNKRAKTSAAGKFRKAAATRR